MLSRFQQEQDGSGADSWTTSSAHITPPLPVIKIIQIDAKPYGDAIAFAKDSAISFDGTVNYGNLLLVCDRSQEAEAVFKELFQRASTQQELDTAAEEIARSLRAEDGNSIRANTWLQSLKLALSAAASQPSEKY
jgi:hypothetical protein